MCRKHGTIVDCLLIRGPYLGERKASTITFLSLQLTKQYLTSQQGMYWTLVLKLYHRCREKQQEVKLAEDMVSRAAVTTTPIGHPLQNTSQLQLASNLRYTGGPFDLPATGLVQGEDGLYMHAGQYTNNQSSSLHHAVSGIKQQNKESQLQPTGTKMGRSPSMQRVASLEHLQKRIRAGTSCGSMSWGGV